MLLAALFGLRITHAENVEMATKIDALVVRLGGDPDAPLFGRTSRLDRCVARVLVLDSRYSSGQ